jgi:hypothetical protein
MNHRINALLSETHNELREQLIAAQRHFTRLEELLASRESKDISALNRAVRRLRASRGGEWVQVVNESVRPFAARTAIFRVQNGALHLEAAPGRVPLEAVSLESAAAFHIAVESQDTVVAVRTAGEMSPSIAGYFGESPSGRFHLFPILSGGRVAALLYADGPATELQPEALELLATVAGAMLDSRTAQPHLSNGLVTLAGVADAGSTDRDLDLKAQRFARVLVAEMRLYQDDLVKNGRAGRDLYVHLKPQIDEAREAYRGAFLAGSDATPDYLHQELVNTLANGDVEMLGQDYPGPLA